MVGVWRLRWYRGPSWTGRSMEEEEVLTEGSEFVLFVGLDALSLVAGRLSLPVPSACAAGPARESGSVAVIPFIHSAAQSSKQSRTGPILFLSASFVFEKASDPSFQKGGLKKIVTYFSNGIVTS